MANQILLITSILMAASHFLAVYWYGGPIVLRLLYVLGPCTSILNHWATNPWTLWTDRSVMAIGCVIDVWFILQLQQRALLWVGIVCSVGFYAGAKYFVEYSHYHGDSYLLVSYVFHVAAHVFVSALHFSILYFYKKTD